MPQPMPPRPVPTPAPTAGTPAPSPPKPAEWSQLRCLPESGQPDLLSDLRLTRELDYAALYRPWMPAVLVAESGTACRTASNVVACRDAIVEHRDSVLACFNAGCSPFLITTSGDAITLIEARAALLTLLGAIDSNTEAVLLASFSGIDVNCAMAGTAPGFGTEVRPIDGGYEVRSQSNSCPNGMRERHTLELGRDGSILGHTIEPLGISSCPVEGRRPAGLRASAPLRASSRLGAYFASAARFEAASVFAFERLARELAALSAPTALVTAALRSSLEEIGHARAMTLLARRFGAEPAAVEIAPWAARDAFAIALENAVEGCAGETYAALVAQYQALSAEDVEARAVFAAIADDETRHAELAWQVARWLEPRLTLAEQRAVEAARAEAFVQLTLAPQRELDGHERALIGYPGAQTARALAGVLGRSLV